VFGYAKKPAAVTIFGAWGKVAEDPKAIVDQKLAAKADG
jgi:hypothetical protein